MNVWKDGLLSWKEVVDEALGDGFTGVLVSDFYASCHHYDGSKQCCWVNLLRDIHDLNLKDQKLALWADAVRGIYDRAKAFNRLQTKRRRTA